MNYGWLKTTDNIAELVLYSMSYNFYARWNIAENPKCPVDILIKFSNDPVAYIRCAVAGNPSCPIEILIKLSDDPVVYIRSTVIRNPVYQKHLKLSQNSSDKTIVATV